MGDDEPLFSPEAIKAAREVFTAPTEPALWVCENGIWWHLENGEYVERDPWSQP